MAPQTLFVSLLLVAAPTLLACSDKDDDSASEADADTDADSDTDTDSDSDTDTDTDTDADIDAARELWNDAALDDYEFVLEWICFCDEKTTGPAVIEVEADKVVSATYVSNGSAVTSNFRIETIDGLFDLLSSAKSVAGVPVTATYDAKLGYPTHAWIDYDPEGDDDELGFEVSGFTPMP